MALRSFNFLKTISVHESTLDSGTNRAQRRKDPSLAEMVNSQSVL
jgi:hypothetical protein